jgi:uncharacterized protein (TIGR00725 family)
MGMVIAVIGAGKASGKTYKLAEKVGAELARKGVMVVCGGLSGVMEAVCKGAHGEGGLSIGLLPRDSTREANKYVDIPIPTGLGIARNVLVVKAGEAVIALDGEHGTLSEIAIALNLGKPVVSLGKWALPNELGRDILQASEPADAVAKAIEAARKALGNAR